MVATSSGAERQRKENMINEKFPTLDVFVFLSLLLIFCKGKQVHYASWLSEKRQLEGLRWLFEVGMIEPKPADGDANKPPTMRNVNVRVNY